MAIHYQSKGQAGFKSSYMLPEIVPVIIPSIDWASYLVASKQVLGRSVTEQLDNSGIRPNSLGAFIITLVNLKDPLHKPNIENSNQVLSHLSFGFLIIAQEDIFLELLELNSFVFYGTDTIIKNTRVSLVTGSLEEWIRNILQIHGSLELRLLFNKILGYLESIGLGDLFSKYRKNYYHDSTFILGEK